MWWDGGGYHPLPWRLPLQECQHGAPLMLPCQLVYLCCQLISPQNDPCQIHLPSCPPQHGATKWERTRCCRWSTTTAETPPSSPGQHGGRRPTLRLALPTRPSTPSNLASSMSSCWIPILPAGAWPPNFACLTCNFTAVSHE